VAGTEKRTPLGNGAPPLLIWGRRFISLTFGGGPSHCAGFRRQGFIPQCGWRGALRNDGDRDYFGLESGGQSGLTFRGLPPLCTVGAAELAPPASDRTALLSTAIELASPRLPATGVVESLGASVAWRRRSGVQLRSR
jgi:hypothetical protein